VCVCVCVCVCDISNSKLTANVAVVPQDVGVGREAPRLLVAIRVSAVRAVGEACVGEILRMAGVDVGVV
jgi:hypothetical protein